MFAKASGSQLARIQVLMTGSAGLNYFGLNWKNIQPDCAIDLYRDNVLIFTLNSNHVLQTTNANPAYGGKLD